MWIFPFSIFPFPNSLGHHVRIKYEGKNIACVPGERGKQLKYEEPLIRPIKQKETEY